MAGEPGIRRPKGHRGPPYLVTPVYPQDLLMATSCWSKRGFCPSSCCPVAFWAFLYPHPHLFLRYQITEASFINAELLDGGGWCPAGIREGVSVAEKWAVPRGKVGDKATECGHSSGLCFLPYKMEKGMGVGVRAMERESRSSPYVYLILT